MKLKSVAFVLDTFSVGFCSAAFLLACCWLENFSWLWFAISSVGSLSLLSLSFCFARAATIVRSEVGRIEREKRISERLKMQRHDFGEL